LAKKWTQLTDFDSSVIMMCASWPSKTIIQQMGKSFIKPNFHSEANLLLE
jgi:hypothetical protein